MPKKEKYRLESLVKLKERQKRKTEELLARAIRELADEKKKLEKLKNLKKEIIEKRVKARSQMNKKVSSGQSRIRESQFHIGYLTKLKEDEEKADKEIAEQKEVFDLAEQKLKRARRDYIDAATELNVMEKHRELWAKKQAQVLSALENKQMNELGNALHQINKMKEAS